MRRQLLRDQFLAFLEGRLRCLVGMEACAGAHHWGRQLRAMGHEVRLMPPSYVKPYVKRGKTDAVDAAAICEAVRRPPMRFVAVNSEVASATSVLHRARDFLVRQVKQTGNAIRAHMAEFGVVADKGASGLEGLASRGKSKNGYVSKMGNRYIRQLLYLGAMAQIMVSQRLGLRTDWLSQKLGTKETKVVAIALVNRMARTIFALLRDGTSYRPQVLAAKPA